jgi:hypothetical protein
LHRREKGREARSEIQKLADQGIILRGVLL